VLCSSQFSATKCIVLRTYSMLSSQEQKQECRTKTRLNSSALRLLLDRRILLKRLPVTNFCRRTLRFLGSSGSCPWWMRRMMTVRHLDRFRGKLERTFLHQKIVLRIPAEEMLNFTGFWDLKCISARRRNFFGSRKYER
jgi:hypothetical protein